jgi:hypothetical protein
MTAGDAEGAPVSAFWKEGGAAPSGPFRESAPHRRRDV